MATTFPAAIDSFTDPISGDYQNSATVPHPNQHANANDAIKAIETALFGIRNDLAAAKIVPGATSWSLRNHADTTDNLKVLDSGALTLLGQNGAAGGADHAMTTGNGTAGTARGGDLTINLGTGTLSGLTYPTIGTARHGEIHIIAPIVTNSAPYINNGYANGYYPHVTINASGLGIGGAAYSGTPFRVVWVDTDPTYQVIAVNGGTSLILTADNANPVSGTGFGVHAYGPGGLSSNPGGQADDSEFHVFSTGTPNFAELTGGYHKIHFRDSSALTPTATPGAATAATATVVYGSVGEITHQGIGTVVTAIGSYGSVVVQNSSSTKDGDITTAVAFKTHLHHEGTNATGSTIATGIGYHVDTNWVASSSTGKFNTVYGVKIDALFNTASASSTAGGFSARGIDLTLPTQGGNTSGTNQNFGLRISGNGGTAGGGGTVTNWAINSTSTAPSIFLGPMSWGNVTAAASTIRLDDAWNMVLGGTTGTIIGTATSQKLAFHNAAPVVQRLGSAQAAVITTSATNSAPFGFATGAQADALVTLVNELRAALVEKGLIKGSA